MLIQLKVITIKEGLASLSRVYCLVTQPLLWLRYFLNTSEATEDIMENSSCPWSLSSPKYILGLCSTPQAKAIGRTEQSPAWQAWLPGLSSLQGRAEGELGKRTSKGSLPQSHPPAIRASSGAANEFSRGSLGGRKKKAAPGTDSRARWEAVEVTVGTHLTAEGSSFLWGTEDVTYFL